MDEVGNGEQALAFEAEQDGTDSIEMAAVDDAGAAGSAGFAVVPMEAEFGADQAALDRDSAGGVFC